MSGETTRSIDVRLHTGETVAMQIDEVGDGLAMVLWPGQPEFAMSASTDYRTDRDIAAAAAAYVAFVDALNPWRFARERTEVQP